MTEQPQFPLSAREYATFTAKEARKVFQGQEVLHKPWGMLFCDDANGAHWTLLGSRPWVDSLREQAEPGSAETIANIPESPSGIPPSGDGVNMDPDGAAAAEWPLEEFRARWVIRGWPDEWEQAGRAEVFPFGEAS